MTPAASGKPRTAPRSFAERRERLDRALPGPKLFVAGLPRPRNFTHNPYPFRAESHFLYFVGRGLPGAALVIDGPSTTLYVEPATPDEAMWFGPRPSLAELADEMEISVRPASELSPKPGTRTLPPQDAETAFWLADLLGRDVEPGGGDRLEGGDADLASSVVDLRLVHDEAAIAQLRYAAVVTAEAHAAGRAATRAGNRESTVRAQMEAAMTERGLGTAYLPIVTTHGNVLHAGFTERDLVPGDLLLADVGAETAEGWASDVTRVWPVSGRFSPSQRDLYEVVLRAQTAAIASVRPGIRFLHVHQAAGLELARGLAELGILRGDPTDLYHAGAIAPFFPHGVGHLLGLDVHDMEDLGDRAGYAPGRTRLRGLGDRYLRLDRDLAKGMCVTIEPGFYRIPGLTESELAPSVRGCISDAELARFSDVRGIRIEDDVLVTEDGCEVLTDAIPKSAEQVG